MRVYSPVGFWRTPGVPVITYLQDPVLDVNVTNDGSVLEFTIPASMRVGSLQGIHVRSTRVLDPGSASTPVRKKVTGWSTALQIVPAG